MKAVILAGGFGTRLSEETTLMPKPMIEIGGKPMLWHIMKQYAHHGINEFVVCLGYKGYMIKEYFFNYYKHLSDFTVDLSNDEVRIHNTKTEKWKVTLVDTGDNVMTGGRLKRILPYVQNEQFFAMTYGDGVSNVNISDQIAFHKKHNKLATITSIYPPGRFGSMLIDQQGLVTDFVEKPQKDGGIINGGFFMLSPKCLDYIQGDSTSWEKEPLEKLAQDNQLMAYFHEGFWQCMDTLRDKQYLENVWTTGDAPWKVWHD